MNWPNFWLALWGTVGCLIIAGVLVFLTIHIGLPLLFICGVAAFSVIVALIVGAMT